MRANERSQVAHGGSDPTCAAVTGDLITPPTKVLLFYCLRPISLHSLVALTVRAKETCCAFL